MRRPERKFWRRPKAIGLYRRDGEVVVKVRWRRTPLDEGEAFGRGVGWRREGDSDGMGHIGSTRRYCCLYVYVKRFEVKWTDLHSRRPAKSFENQFYYVRKSSNCFIESALPLKTPAIPPP